MRKPVLRLSDLLRIKMSCYAKNTSNFEILNTAIRGIDQTENADIQSGQSLLWGVEWRSG